MRNIMIVALFAMFGASSLFGQVAPFNQSGIMLGDDISLDLPGRQTQTINRRYIDHVSPLFDDESVMEIHADESGHVVMISFATIEFDRDEDVLDTVLVSNLLETEFSTFAKYYGYIFEDADGNVYEFRPAHLHSFWVTIETPEYRESFQ